jgi:hypothetical protein
LLTSPLPHPSLTKQPEARPTAARLLDHPFIKKHEGDDFDVGAWMRECGFMKTPPADMQAAAAAGEAK